MKALVYIVEDDKDLSELLKYNLQKDNFTVEIFNKGSELFKALQTKTPDIFILDVMLPDYDGFRIAHYIRSNPEWHSIPIVFLTAKDSEIDKLKGFSYGADDYVTKPFSIKELTARMKAILRRLGKLEFESLIKLGTLEIDLSKKEVRKQNQTLNLTVTEFKILEALLTNYGKPISREFLIEKVLQKEVYDRTIDVHIKNLREKLGEEGQFIKTVRGFGYKLEI